MSVHVAYDSGAGILERTQANYQYLPFVEGTLKFDGVSHGRQTKESLAGMRFNYPWMDVLTADRIMGWGPVPLDRLLHATRTKVEAGLREVYGHCHSWWQKLGALYPPSGQLKNFYNAALVAHQLPSGSKMAIIGSRYSAGSGDWVLLLCHWLNNMGRDIEIHCFDPNEAEGILHVGTIKAISYAKAVERSKLRGYKGIVDDVYVPVQGYDFSSRVDADFVSYKMYQAEEVKGQYYPPFLHYEESRYFNFPQAWDDAMSPCKCQRCRIETYLGIGRYGDIVDPSSCREHIPEVYSLSEQWQLSNVGEVPGYEDYPVAKRAKIVLETIIAPMEQKTEVTLVDRIIGYSPADIPFKAVATANPWYAEFPTVVARPGTIASMMGRKVSKADEDGWNPVSKKGEWTTYERPTTRLLLRTGRSTIIWSGVEVEKNRKIILIEGKMQVECLGKREVKQWCFLHRCEDACGLCTSHLFYPKCNCGHRHGSYDLSQWGVQCGTLKITTNAVFETFMRGIGVREYDIPTLLTGARNSVVQVVKENPGVTESMLHDPPNLLRVKESAYYIDWEALLLRFPMTEEAFLTVLRREKVVWDFRLYDSPDCYVQRYKLRGKWMIRNRQRDG
jgi:hypothetical protein